MIINMLNFSLCLIQSKVLKSPALALIWCFKSTNSLLVYSFRLIPGFPMKSFLVFRISSMVALSALIHRMFDLVFLADHALVMVLSFSSSIFRVAIIRMAACLILASAYTPLLVRSQWPLLDFMAKFLLWCCLTSLQFMFLMPIMDAIFSIGSRITGVTVTFGGGGRWKLFFFTMFFTQSTVDMHLMSSDTTI